MQTSGLAIGITSGLVVEVPLFIREMVVQSRRLRLIGAKRTFSSGTNRIQSKAWKSFFFIGLETWSLTPSLTDHVGATMHNQEPSSSPMGPESRVVASGSEVHCDLAGEMVILNLDSGVYYGMNSVGARVWELLKEPRTIRELCDSISGEFEVEDSTCLADLIALLEDLQGAGLVQVRS